MPDSDLTRPRDERAAAARDLGDRLARQLSDGELPPVAAMQLLMQAETPAEAQAALRAAQRVPTSGALGGSALPASRSASALRRIRELISDNPGAWHTVHRLAESIAHRPVRGDALAHWANVFDRLVRLSPEGSVALYSLGDARLLEEATAEIVALLDDWGLLDATSAVLDIGCGIGRLEAALGPRVASVYGIDISAARVLERGGSLLVLNATYGGDADADLIELAQLAEGAGLEIHRADWCPLSSWDAPAFELKHASRSRA